VANAAKLNWKASPRFRFASAGRSGGPPVSCGTANLARRRQAEYQTPMRILVIEDDREAASYLVKALAEAGHVADQAFDGESGFELASGGNYDVLVVDRMLPSATGLSVISDLRARATACRC
jgi:two-component system OmpR family response regulator